LKSYMSYWLTLSVLVGDGFVVGSRLSWCTLSASCCIVVDFIDIVWNVFYYLWSHTLNIFLFFQYLSIDIQQKPRCWTYFSFVRKMILSNVKSQ
jgi:hypothetical protein